jgi:hypothetical protein
MTNAWKEGGAHPNICKNGFLNYIKWILLIFSLILMGFFPLLGYLETDLRLNIGRKLGGEPQIRISINHRFLTVQKIS